MVNTVTATTDPAAETAASMKKSLGLNKEEFLKLFIAQLQYQDPLKPQDPTAMLDQLSQLSLVEQAYSNNTTLSNLLSAQNNSISLNALSFIGKDIRANGNITVFKGSSPTSLEFDLPIPVSSAQITISDSQGNVVRSEAVGPYNTGSNRFVWDGRNNGGTVLPAGAYKFAVTAKSANGDAVPVKTYTAGRIDGVNLSGNTPQLTIGTASVSLSDVLSVKEV